MTNFTVEFNNLNYSKRSISDSFFDTFKRLKEEIYYIVQKIRERYDIDSHIKDLKNSFFKMQSILSSQDTFEDEFYYFSSIKDMLFYILEDKTLLVHIGLIYDIFKKFYDLICLKFKDSDEYLNYNEQFSIELVNYEQKFYCDIYKPSENYDEDVLSDLTNLVLDL